MEAPNILFRGFRESNLRQYLATVLAAGLAMALRGLRRMPERVIALGGAFEILSEGKGTTVKVAIPLQASVREQASAAHA